VQGNRVKEESGSFLKKITKKPLIVWAEPIRKGRSLNTQKFFASFFKKEGLALACLPSPDCPAFARPGH
jgi:hypothetical protein